MTLCAGGVVWSVVELWQRRWEASGGAVDVIEALGKFNIGRRRSLKDAKEQNVMLKTAF